MNPLSPNLIEFTDDQLFERMNSIQQRLRGSGRNPDVVRQLMLMLNDCQQEQLRRVEASKKLLDDGLDRLIDI